MSDDESWRHTDIEFLVFAEFGSDEALGGFSNWLQTFNEEAGDAWDEFHHGTHLDANLQGLRNVGYHFVPVFAGQTADDDADEHTQEQWFAKKTELLLHTLRVNLNFVDARDVVKHLVDDHSKRHKALAEWLWNRNAIHARIELLETLGRDVGKYQGDDVADDSGKESPSDRVGHKVADRSDECEVPVVPKVDVHGACAAKQQKHQVHTQTHGDNE